MHTIWSHLHTWLCLRGINDAFPPNPEHTCAVVSMKDLPVKCSTSRFFNCPDDQLPQSPMATSLPVHSHKWGRDTRHPKMNMWKNRRKTGAEMCLHESYLAARLCLEDIGAHTWHVFTRRRESSRDSCRGVSNLKAVKIAGSSNVLLSTIWIFFFSVPPKNTQSGTDSRGKWWGGGSEGEEDGGEKKKKEEEDREGGGGSSLPGWSVVDYLKQRWAPHLLLYCSIARQQRELHVAPTDSLQNKDTDSSVGWIQDSAALQINTLLLLLSCTHLRSHYLPLFFEVSAYCVLIYAFYCDWTQLTVPMSLLASISRRLDDSCGCDWTCGCVRLEGSLSWPPAFSSNDVTPPVDRVVAVVLVLLRPLWRHPDTCWNPCAGVGTLLNSRIHFKMDRVKSTRGKHSQCDFFEWHSKHLLTLILWLCKLPKILNLAGFSCFLF